MDSGGICLDLFALLTMNGLQEVLSSNVKEIPTDVLKLIQRISLQELQKRKQYESAASKVFNGAFAGIPWPGREPNRFLAKYYSLLLDQDWSHLFSGDAEQKYYVYAHVKPSAKKIHLEHDALPLKMNGVPFYIGKGTGDRAYDLKRNQGHGAFLKELQDAGVNKSDIVHIVSDCLSEPKAFELESKLIYLFGTKYEADRRGMLVNLDIPARPEFVPFKQWAKAQSMETKWAASEQ